MAGPISLLQRQGKGARAQDLRDTADLAIHYRPSPVERVTICVFADASFKTVPGWNSQGATMLCVVDQEILEG